MILKRLISPSFFRSILRRPNCKSLTALCLALFVSSAAQKAGADVDVWLDRLVEAYGGEAQIMRASEFQQYGVIFSRMRGREGQVRRSYRYPDHLRIAIEYGENDSELRLLAGSRSWKQNKETGQPFYSAMIMQATRLGLPAVLIAHRKSVKYGGEYRDSKDRLLHLLELSFHGTNHLAVGIDPQSGRIVESASTIKLGNFKMQFGTHYDDYREVDGRLFAFRETHFVMGRETGHTTFERIVVEPLPDELFYPQEVEPGKKKEEIVAGVN